MKTTLTRNECLNALISIDDRSGMARDIFKFINDKYFWNSERRFTSTKFIDLLMRLHNQGRWQDENQKSIFNDYINKLETYK